MYEEFKKEIKIKKKTNKKNNINLSSNELHSELQKQVLNEINNLIRLKPCIFNEYNYLPYFIELFKQKLNLDEKIIITSGADHAISCILQGLRKKYNNILLLRPTYENYNAYANYYDYKITTLNIDKYIIRDNEFHLDEDKLFDEIFHYLTKNPQTVVVVVNPDGFFGTEYCKNKLSELINFNRREHTIIFDNVYSGFDQINQEGLSKYDFANNCIFIHSTSKYYGLAGLRLGYAEFGNSTLHQFFVLANTANTIPTFCFNYFFKYIELNDPHIYDEVQNSKKKLYDFFDREGIQFFYTKTNFILFYSNCNTITKKLEAKHIIVRKLDDYYPELKYWIRMTIPSSKEVDYVINSLKEIIHEFEID